MPVCLNHTDREALAKCGACFKPLCAECITRRGRFVYCSEECLHNYTQNNGDVVDFAAREEVDRGKKRKLGFAVVGAAAFILIVLIFVLL